MAEEEQRTRAGGYEAPITASLFEAPDQRLIWPKHLWSRLPSFVWPAIYFIYRYFLRAGFSGREGGISYFLQSYWHRLLVDIKLDEITIQ